MNTIYLLLITTLVLVSLCEVCSATRPGSSQTFDNPNHTSAYLVYLISNRFLYNMSYDDSTSPTEQIVKYWIQSLNEAFNITLKYTSRLGKVLISRCNTVKAKVKSIRGSGPREKYLQLDWELRVLTEEQSTLNKRVATLPGRSVKRKAVSEYSPRHQRRLKKVCMESCKQSLEWMEQQGLQPLKVVAINRSTNEIETFVVNDLPQVFGEELTEHESDRVSMMLYIKDRYNVSGQAYQELSKVCKEMPRHYSIKLKIRELKSLWNIHPTPNNTCGIQQKLEERLSARIQHLILATSPEAEFQREKAIRVKISGDGTRIGKRLHVVNVTFTLLDEGDAAFTYEGNYILAILKEPEKYAELKLALEDLIHEVSTLTTILVNGVRYKVIYYLGGDWKFLAMVTGIDSATSKYPCIWCKCPKDERYNPEKVWSIEDSSHGARTIKENVQLCSSTRKQRFNVSNTPLFPTIPLKNVVIDNLHLFLRVADVLIDLLITELKRHDCIEKQNKFKSFDSTAYKHLAEYERFVISLGIPGFNFYIGQTSKSMKCRSLTGPEKLKLFKNIDIGTLLPNLQPHSNAEKIQHLWTELLALNTIFSKRSSDITEEDLAAFENRARNWGRKFIEVYHDHNVTPYIHALMNHVHEFLNLHGGFLQFSQHGLEKYNDIMTKQYFRGSNHRGRDALVQIMQKQNRLEHLRDVEKQQTAKCFSITCSNCSQKGHNRLTCTQPCTKCKHTPYCGHLTEIGRIPTCSQVN